LWINHKTLRQNEHADPQWKNVGKNGSSCRKKRIIAVLADPQ
jgi:hypothetical protein